MLIVTDILQCIVKYIVVMAIQKVNESYRKHIWALLLGPFLKVIEAVFDLLIPLFMKAIIDLASYSTPNAIPNPLSRLLASFIRIFPSINGHPHLSDALIGGAIILLMGVVGFLITMICQYIAAKTSVEVGSEIRDSLFEKIMSLSLKEKNKIGNNKLLTIINSDSYLVQQGVLIFIRLIVRAPFIIIGSLVISFILDYRIGFVFLAIVPIILLIIFIAMRKSSKEYLAIQEKLDELSSKTTDTISGTKIIRGFNKVSEENTHYEKKATSYKSKATFVGAITALINPLTFAVISLATIMVTYFGGMSILHSHISSEMSLYASTLITEIAYLTQIFVTLMQLTNVVLILTKAGASTKRVNEVLSITPTIINDSDVSKSINVGEEIISFNNVSLSYVEGGNNTLEDISFSLKKGKSLGIIGPTGSGKSSIISLIERYIDPTNGDIFYKGISSKEYSLSKLREDIGYVPQKSLLFKGSIKSNLLFAKEDASEEEMVTALKLACAYEFVSKYEDGLNHEVKEGGSNFSGGQRQRLCIARALLKHPEILILDDSTSALDLLTEKTVRENISKTYKDLTKIIVSQRIASIKDSDEIILLTKGHISAIGSHEELLKTSKTYKEIYMSQVEEGDKK